MTRQEPPSDETAGTRDGSKQVLALAALLLLGIALQMMLWSRQWIYGDQYALLTPALEYARGGGLAPVSKGMSGGGQIPGTLLQLLVGIPLRLWADYRAPALAIGLSQIIAVAILLSTVGTALGRRAAVFFAAVYWLSPWRLYHAGFLWEPGFVLLPAALHMGCCWLLRGGGEPAATGVDPGDAAGPDEDLAKQTAYVGFAASLGLGAVLVATPQIHGSFVVLVVATIILAWTRRIRIRVFGAAAGAIAAGLTLVPTIVAFAGKELPRVAPQIDERVALPLLVISNAGKAFAYWLRFGSADIGRRLRQTAWLSEPPAGTEPGITLPPLVVTSVAVLTVASVIIAVVAAWYYARGGTSASTGSEGTDFNPRADWMRAYVLTMLAAVVISGAISPVPIQGWHLVIALPAACIPVAIWIQQAYDRRGARRALVVGFIGLFIIASALVGLGHPTYMRPDALHVEQQDIPENLRPLVTGER